MNTDEHGLRKPVEPDVLVGLAEGDGGGRELCECEEESVKVGRTVPVSRQGGSAGRLALPGECVGAERDLKNPTGRRVPPFGVLQVSRFSLQAVLRLEGELAGRAVALVDETRRPPVVIEATAEALAAGVEIGQTVPQAMARCAEIVLRTAQSEAEAEARAGLMAAAFSVSPQIEDTAPGVCTIQMGGVAAERREPAMRAAVAELEKLGLRATAGLAATPLVAWYAARFGGLCGEACRAGSPDPAAGEETAALKNDGTAGSGDPALHGRGGEVVVVGEGETRGFLRELPLSVAEPLAETATILAGWGVRTLGDLTDLSKADVTQRLGPAGLALWERAAGEVKRPLTLVSPAQTFAAEMTLEHEIETLEPLLFILQRFVDRLALALRTAGWVAGEMSLGLMLSDETVYARDFRLPEPTAQEEILFRVLQTHLETLHTAATVRGATLECRPVRPLTRQQGLFESGLRDPHGFSETLARVSAVVGADRVGTPVLENTHRADAVTLVAPPAVVPPPVEEGIHARRGLPLRRFRLPVAATVELEGMLPAFVWTPVMSGAVKALAGPWRGSGDWWDDGRRWAREEWDAELEAGGVYRLMRTPKGWFVEGEYD